MQWMAALTLGLLVFLSGFSPHPTAETTLNDLPDLMDPALTAAIAANRSDSAAESGADLSGLLYPYTQFADDATIARIAYVEEKPPQSVSLEAAEDDVRFLFEMFKYGYALYQAFGGDEVFPQARDRTLETLPSLARSNGSVPVSALHNSILEQIAFIRDGHSSFGGVRLYTHYDWYYNARYIFRKDDSGYYTTTHSSRLAGLVPACWSGDKRYLVSVDGQSPDESLALSLTADGELVYILSRVAASSAKRLLIQLDLRDEAGDYRVEVSLQRDVTEILPGFDLEPFYSRTPYRLETRDGIPIVVHRSSIPAPTADEIALEEFVAGADALRSNDVVILDLRHHQGGQGEYPLRWISAFMGTTLSYENRWAELTTRTSFRLHQTFAERYYQGNDSELAAAAAYFDERIAYLDSHPEAAKEAWALRGEADNQPDLLPNPTTLFVLIDEKTGSAGEEFVSLLRQFENVIFVGEKTKGLIVSGSPAWGTLPNSRLPFVLAVDIFLGAAQEGLEGIGYRPDIWVEPGQALARVLRYIDARS